MKAQAIALALSLFAIAGTASAIEGPYAYDSNGSTQPVLQYDAQGNLIAVQCTQGSRCVLKTANTTFSPGQVQTSQFEITTGASVNTDHFAFGVRGNAVNSTYCVDGSSPPSTSIRDFPFLGRGFIIYPMQGQVKFENYTQNCKTLAGVPQSTTRSIAFRPNTTYLITLSANDANIWYSVERKYYNIYDRVWDYMPVASGDCLAQASAGERDLCAKTSHAEDNSPQTNRAFILSTDDLVWSVRNWYLQKD